MITSNYLSVLCFLILIISSCKTRDQKENRTVIDTTYYDLDAALLNKSNVKTLILREKDYKVFPTEILELTSLEYLDLSMNNITEMPQDFSKLAKLVDLNLSHNSIYEIPKELTGLNRLEQLALAFNKISNIPSSICSIKNLRNLNLSRNDIIEVNDCIVSLKLKKLTLIPKKLDPNKLRKKYQSLFDKLEQCKVLI